MRTACALAVTLVLATHLASAAPTTDHPLDDAAHLIDSVDETRIESDLRELRGAGVEMAVILLQHTGVPIERYTRDAAHAWATGRSAAAVLVLAIGDRKSRLEVSDALRAVFPDRRAQAILDNARGYLRNADYTGAVRAIIAEVAAAHRGDAPDLESPHPQSGLPATTPSSHTTPSLPTPTPTRYQRYYERERTDYSWVLIPIAIAILLGIGALWAKSSRSSNFTLSHDGTVHTLQRPFVVDWLWHTLKIFGVVLFVIFAVIAAGSNSNASSSSWDSSSSSGGSSWGGGTNDSWGGSSGSSSGGNSGGSSGSSGGGWSGGGASSSW